MTVMLQLGLPEHLRAEAAKLYWQAFGSKLGRVMGPERKALQFLRRVIRGDHVIIGLNPQGQLVGMAGFKSAAGSFAGGEMADIFAVYGVFGAAWRLPLLWMLGNDLDNERFLLDGLCVERMARNQGIGTALMQAVEAEAIQRGYGSVRLDVVDNNKRAMALYQRLGYVIEKSQDIGLLRLAFRFRSSTTMVKAL